MLNYNHFFVNFVNDNIYLNYSDNVMVEGHYLLLVIGHFVVVGVDLLVLEWMNLIYVKYFDSIDMPLMCLIAHFALFSVFLNVLYALPSFAFLKPQESQ